MLGICFFISASREPLTCLMLYKDNYGGSGWGVLIYICDKWGSAVQMKRSPLTCVPFFTLKPSSNWSVFQNFENLTSFCGKIPKNGYLFLKKKKTYTWIWVWFLNLDRPNTPLAKPYLSTPSPGSISDQQVRKDFCVLVTSTDPPSTLLTATHRESIKLRIHQIKVTTHLFGLRTGFKNLNIYREIPYTDRPEN